MWNKRKSGHFFIKIFESSNKALTGLLRIIKLVL